MSNESEIRQDDLLAQTDGRNPIITDEMRVYIDDLLKTDFGDEEAIEIAADFQEEQLPDNFDISPDTTIPQASADEPPALIDEPDSVVANPVNNTPIEDDDGFTVVGKKNGKKNQKKNKQSHEQAGQSKNTTQRQTSSSHQNQPQPAIAQGRAVAAEKRPVIPGNPNFPICFMCAKRHDFGECD